MTSNDESRVTKFGCILRTKQYDTRNKSTDIVSKISIHYVLYGYKY